MSEWMVWRGTQPIGACETLDQAKAYAKRNAAVKPETFYVGRKEREYRAEVSIDGRANWEPV